MSARSCFRWRQPPTIPPRRYALAIAVGLIMVFAAVMARWTTSASRATVHSPRDFAAPDQLGLLRSGGDASAGPPRGLIVRVEVDGRPVARFAIEKYRAAGRLDVKRLHAAVIRWLPRSATLREGAATITYRYQRQRTARRVVLAADAGGSVALARVAIASRIAAPIIRQTMRNDCESAALSALLRSVGVAVSQTRLQRQLSRSGPLDPQARGRITVWGDPDRGFVGRPDGGGAAGGFGVYEPPIVALAKRHGVQLAELTGASPTAVYRRLLAGRAVMAWVGLGNGPYGKWRSPAGRRIRVNFNEHAVVLRGVAADGSIFVANPLRGTAETWTPEKFVARWTLLGRRALST